MHELSSTPRAAVKFISGAQGQYKSIFDCKMDRRAEYSAPLCCWQRYLLHSLCGFAQELSEKLLFVPIPLWGLRIPARQSSYLEEPSCADSPPEKCHLPTQNTGIHAHIRSFIPLHAASTNLRADITAQKMICQTTRAGSRCDNGCAHFVYVLHIILPPEGNNTEQMPLQRYCLGMQKGARASRQAPRKSHHQSCRGVLRNKSGKLLRRRPCILHFRSANVPRSTTSHPPAPSQPKPRVTAFPFMLIMCLIRLNAVMLSASM